MTQDFVTVAAFICVSSSGAGGTLGLKFYDSYYSDNRAGSPNSVWDLELAPPLPPTNPQPPNGGKLCE